MAPSPPRIRPDPYEKPEEEHSRCAALVVLLCPCLVLITLLLIVASIVLAVKFRLYCRGPLRPALSHLFSHHKC